MTQHLQQYVITVYCKYKDKTRTLSHGGGIQIDKYVLRILFLFSIGYTTCQKQFQGIEIMLLNIKHAFLLYQVPSIYNRFHEANQKAI